MFLFTYMHFLDLKIAFSSKLDSLFLTLINRNRPFFNGLKPSYNSNLTKPSSFEVSKGALVNRNDVLMRYGVR